MLNDGDCIEFLADVRAPVAQTGSKGERRIVGKTIGNYPANYLFRGGYIKKVEEPPETTTAPAATERDVTAPAATERDNERSNENGEYDGRADQEGDYREQDEPETEAD